MPFVNSVFLSATFGDLKKEREAVIREFIDVGILPFSMELFPAHYRNKQEYIKDLIWEAVSLEARVPFLSKKLVEFAFSLSEEDRCPKGMEKGLLKKAYEKEIGKELLYRSKKGFCVPTNYFKASQSPQELILEQLWKSKKG